jgi:hypothetical protein
MDILKDNWDSPLEYVVSLFNNYYNINITKYQIEIVFNTFNFFGKTTQMFLSMIFCLLRSLEFPLLKFFLISKFKWNTPI